MTSKIQIIRFYMKDSAVVRILLHIIFWIFIALFYFMLFSWRSEFREISIIFSAGLLPVAIAATYFFNYILVPKYLWNKRYGKFFLLSAFTLLTAVWISFLIVFFTLMFILNQKSYIAPSTLNPELQVITLNFVVFLAIAIKQIKRTFFIQQEKNELEKTKLTTELKLREAELKLLKAQIHPHFLFNTLNNLYGLTLEKSEEAPQLVLRLSEMLDYILYRCNEKRVFLSEEIKNLKNYIEIEKVRHSHKLSLKVRLPGETGELKIAPLILLPFMENAFKHGAGNSAGTAFIELLVILKNHKLEVILKNSKNEKKHKNDHASKGIGLNNVRKRLELLYPEKHLLKIEDKTDTFSVNLMLQLD